LGRSRGPGAALQGRFVDACTAHIGFLDRILSMRITGPVNSVSTLYWSRHDSCLRTTSSMRGKLVVAIGTLVLAPPARADHTSVHATADGEVVTTDNLYAAGSGSFQRPDMFFTVRPGVLYAYDAPQMVHDFNADAEVVGYLSRSDKPFVTGRAAWRSIFLPTPRTTLAMSISAGTGLLSLLATRLSPDDTTATVTPS